MMWMMMMILISLNGLEHTVDELICRYTAMHAWIFGNLKARHRRSKPHKQLHLMFVCHHCIYGENSFDMRHQAENVIIFKFPYHLVALFSSVLCATCINVHAPFILNYYVYKEHCKSCSLIQFSTYFMALCHYIQPNDTACKHANTSSH